MREEKMERDTRRGEGVNIFPMHSPFDDVYTKQIKKATHRSQLGRWSTDQLERKKHVVRWQLFAKKLVGKPLVKVVVWWLDDQRWPLRTERVKGRLHNANSWHMLNAMKFYKMHYFCHDVMSPRGSCDRWIDLKSIFSLLCPVLRSTWIRTPW